VRRLVRISFVGGIRRVNGAPAILAGVWLMTIAATLPLAGTLRVTIVRHLDSSLEGDAASEGLDDRWIQEFAAHASGVGVTFKPTILGFAAVLASLSAMLDATPQPTWIIVVAAAYAAGWLYLCGGIIDRFGRDENSTPSRFWRACATFAPRLLRLAAIEVVTYGVLFTVVRKWLFDRLGGNPTDADIVDRGAWMYKACVYVAFTIMLGACNLLFDYAKMFVVVGNGRRVVSAVRAAARFVGRHAPTPLALYLLDGAVFLGVIVVYGLVVPEVGRGPLVWIAVGLGQLFVVARLWVKLLFWASEATLFRAREQDSIGS
jgi:hypothetical protein